jgi:hypothetical protein
MPLQYAEVLTPTEKCAQSFKTFVDTAGFLLFAYIVIGLTSLLGVVMGERIPYMPFWHAPWKFLLQQLVS